MTDGGNRSALGVMEWLSVLARFILGLVFVLLGYLKAGDPVSFLKVLREYALFPEGTPLILNVVAATLPWIEIFCGLLLLLGVAIRGSSLLLFLLLLSFTVAIVWRAMGVQDAEGIAFCDVAFDCGCGSGVERVCRKVPENLGLLLCAVLVFLKVPTRWSLYPTLFGNRGNKQDGA